MKFKWTEDTTRHVVSNSVVAMIAVAFYFILKNFAGISGALGRFLSILTPFIIGFIIAYLLSRPINFLEAFLNKHLFRKAKKQKSINRSISISVVIVATLVLLALVMYSLIPQLLESVSTLARNTDLYIRKINILINSLSRRFNLDAAILTDLLGSSQELFKKITQYVAAGLPKLLDFSVSLGSGISSFVIGIIISIYMLSGKDSFRAQSKKLISALFPKKIVDGTLLTAKYMHETFGNYISGQILDSLILGVVLFILMSIFGMEYALLISMIVTITNLIPFIGPFIGAIPSAFILLMVQPGKVIWFIILILVLQQLEGNILAPKIVGKTTGLSAFWVIFSIIVGGGLFGVWGVILAVPTFSVLSLFLRHFINRKLAEKELPTDTDSYK